VRRYVAPWIRNTSLGLSILAVGMTGYLTVTHYADPTALACPETGIINCTAVTTSTWSVILGVPVALLGLLWALGMTALNSPWAWRSSTRWLELTRLAVSGTGAVAVLYLVYIELFRVDAICLWCTAVYFTAVALLAMSLIARSPARSANGQKLA
jgi:uncharacterized membrane protein